MAGQYSREDLLKLKESPLVAPPPGLPPKEEWMGVQEPRTRVSGTRTRPDDVFGSAEAFQKRPTLGDAGRRSTTDPDKIHLGPPRHSFASSRPRDDKDSKTGKTTACGPTSFRTVDESEDTRPPRRSFKDSSFEEAPTRAHRNTSSKLDQPWIRKDRGSDVDDQQPAWRRNTREHHNEKQEVEPEWADADDNAESSKPRTQADLAAFMAKMKGQQPPQQVPPPVFTFKPVVASVPAELQEKNKSARPLTSTADTEKDWEDFAANKTIVAGRAPAKSRFADIFGHKDVVVEKAPEKEASSGQPFVRFDSLPPPPPKKSAIKAADEMRPDSGSPSVEDSFAHLMSKLQMLHSGQSQNSGRPESAVTANVTATRSPVATTSAAAAVPVPAPAVSVAAGAPTTHTPKMSLGALIESRSPAARPAAERSSSSAGAEALLSLLRKQDTKEVAGSPVFDKRSSGLAVKRQREGGVRSLFDDPAMASYRQGTGSLFASMNDQSYQANSAAGHGTTSSRSAAVSSQQTRIAPPPGLEPRQSPPQEMPVRRAEQSGYDNGSTYQYGEATRRFPPGLEQSSAMSALQSQTQRTVPSAASYATGPIPSTSAQAARDWQMRNQPQHQRRPTNEFATQATYTAPPPSLSTGQAPSVMDLLRRGGVHTMGDRARYQFEADQERARQQQAEARRRVYDGFGGQSYSNQTGHGSYQGYGYQ